MCAVVDIPKHISIPEPSLLSHIPLTLSLLTLSPPTQQELSELQSTELQKLTESLQAEAESQLLELRVTLEMEMKEKEEELKLENEVEWEGVGRVWGGCGRVWGGCGEGSSVV